MRALGRRLAFVVGVLLATPVVAVGQTVTAAWDPNPASDGVLNYEVCVGTTSGSCNVLTATLAASQTSYTFSPAPGVLHRVSVRAVSAAGPGSYSPEITVSIPGFGSLSNRTSTVNAAITPITITATDPDGGTITYSHTGLPFGLTLNPTTGAISGTPTSTGTYNVSIIASDGLASTSGTFVWTIQNATADTTAPTLNISSHTSGQTVTTANITLAGTATDSGAGGSGITVVTVNGVNATGGSATGNTTANWSRAVTLVTGANVLTVIAVDGAGNARTSSITINLSAADTTAPSLTISSHTNGQTVNTSSITLAGTATDNGAGGSGITSVTVNGAAATGGTAAGTATANWSRGVTLASGANVLTVTAVDGAGNPRTASITINLSVPDTAAPSLTISSHTNGQTVNTPSITLAGTATDNGTGGTGIASVTVNGATAGGGTAAGSATANWSSSVALVAGANALTVVATDGSGNSRQSQITVNYVAPDIAAPSLTISSHSNGQTVNTPNITLGGTATDSGVGGSGITSVTVNGVAASGGTAAGSATANWSRAITLAGGANVLTVVATDGSGNSRQSQITVNYVAPDTTGPTLTISSHTNGQTVNTPNITLAGTATDSGVGGNGIASVTVNGAAAGGGTATGSATANWSSSVALVAGANALTVVATDGSGNSRQSQITVNYVAPDTTAPSLTISSHTSGQTVSSPTITLSGTATDSGSGGSGITSVTVNGAGATGGTASGNGTANWSSALTLVQGANTVTVVARDGANNARTVSLTITYAPTVVSAVSTSPNAGSGTTQTFALQYSDTAGATDLSTTWVWFNPTLTSTSTNSCLIQYVRANGTINLLNDGSSWMPGTPGSGSTLQNSQCAINLAGSSASLSGNTLTLNLAMTFKPGYAGAKNIYMYAQNGSNVISGWQSRGAWTVPAGASTVTADAASPNTGSGATQTFALQYSDTLGATDLSTAWVWFNATLASTSSNSCLVQYSRANGTISLLNDASSAWTPATLGSSNGLQNSQCAISLAGSSASLSGNTLTLNLAMTFKPAYSGAKNIYMYAANANVNSGWQSRGAWTVPTGTTTPPPQPPPPAPTVGVTADSVTPNSGSGSTQTFALQYSDGAGATDLASTWVWFTAAFGTSSNNSCLLYYNRSTGNLNLLNDGSVWIPAALAGGGTLQNSQCAVNLTASSVVLSGNTLTLNLAMTFKPSYVGAKNIYMYAQNAATVNSGWQARGSWTVTGTGQTIIAADSATPNSGSATTQTFALQYSDSAGATDLSTVWVWFNTSLSSTANGSCLLFYDRSSGRLLLLDDSGSMWGSGALGSVGVLQNSSCSINLSASSASLSGSNLTLNLETTFKQGFGGTKNIYMYAQNASGVTSGWQMRGSWVVQ